MNLAKKIDFHIKKDDRGELVFLESLKDIPFEIKRIYFLKNLEFLKSRGFHAHKNLKQVMFCISGSCKLILDNGKIREEILLDSHSFGVYLESFLWREMHEFSENCILFVLASEHYDESDYIRSYSKFLEVINE